MRIHFLHGGHLNFCKLTLSHLPNKNKATCCGSALKVSGRGLNSFRQVTEVKLGRVRSNSGWVTSETDLTTHLVVLRRDVEIKGPMPGCGMHSGPKLAFSSKKS